MKKSLSNDAEIVKKDITTEDIGDGKLLETSSPIFAVGYVIATLVLISSLCSIALLVVKAIPFAKRVIKEHNEPKEVEVK